jgi:hypothetical protein
MHGLSAATFRSNSCGTKAMPNPSFNADPRRQEAEGWSEVRCTFSQPSLTLPASAVGVNSNVRHHIQFLQRSWTWTRSKHARAA